MSATLSILSQLEAVSAEMATGPDHSSATLVELANHRGELIDRLLRSGELAPAMRQQVEEILQAGMLAERRLSSCRTALRSQLADLERDKQLLTELKEGFSTPQNTLDLRA
jgi:hypothetical protein